MIILMITRLRLTSFLNDGLKQITQVYELAF